MSKETHLRKDLHANFDKSENLFGKTLKKMDTVFKSASNSLTLWVILFTVFFFVLLYKFA